MAETSSMLERARAHAEARPRRPLDGEALGALTGAVSDLFTEQAHLVAKAMADGRLGPGERAAVEDAVARVARQYEAALGYEPPEDLQARHAALLAAIEQQARGLSALIAGDRVDSREALDLAALRLREAGRGLPRPTSAPQQGAVPERVFDRTTGRSRYDADEPALLAFDLACPRDTCAAVASYRLLPRHATQRLTCTTCKTPFTVYGSTARLASGTPGLGIVDHTVVTRDPDGVERQIRFREAAEPPGLVIEPGDLLLVLYDVDNRMRRVRNYSTGREVLVDPGSRCFVATAAFGPHAAEVERLRRFRDETLVRSAAGRALVAVYGVVGPPAAAFIAQSERRRGVARRLLRRLASRLP